MIDSKEFINFVQKSFDFITGVPCSYFKDFLKFISETENDLSLRHIFVTREDEAIGIASGIALTGKRAIVYMQNSGLGNIGDALTSLAQLYKLPMIIFVSYRGLEDDRDFPEHSLMGEVTEPFLEALKVPYFELTELDWESDIKKALQVMNQTTAPVVLLIKKGVLSS